MLWNNGTSWRKVMKVWRSKTPRVLTWQRFTIVKLTLIDEIKSLRGRWKSAGNTKLRIHKKLVYFKTPTYLCLPHYNLVLTECNQMKVSSPVISVFTLYIQSKGISFKGCNTLSYKIHFDFFSINLHDHHHCVLYRIESESQVYRIESKSQV